MTASDWAGPLAGLALVALVAVVARLGLRGGALRREQRCSFVCPAFQTIVDCRIVQDIRTGQWKEVRACSAFPDPEQVVCERECRQRMNLGYMQLRRT